MGPLLKSLVSKSSRPVLFQITSFWVTEHLVKVLTQEILSSISKSKPSIAAFRFLASLDLTKLAAKPQLLTPLSPIALGSLMKFSLLDKYSTDVLAMLGSVIDSQSFVTLFYGAFQSYCLKYVEFAGSSSKSKYLTLVFLQTFQNILGIMKNGVQNLNEKIRIGVWRHCLHVVGNGGSRLEQIIKKSNHFVKNLDLGYLEGETNLFA